MKIARHAKLLELIEQQEIETQEELSLALKELGVDVTQATISRDIKDLRLVKVLGRTGKYKYALMKDQANFINERLMKIFSQTILSIDYSGNIIVLKTFSGAANAACEAIDAFGIEHIIGTIAGDNTIFVLVREDTDIEKVIEKFKKMLE